MKTKTPEILTPDASNSIKHRFDVSGDKGSEIQDSSQICRKVLNLFLSGGQYSNVEISMILRTPDPRSHIRELRKRGYKISDNWVKSKNSRYKIYFLK